MWRIIIIIELVLGSYSFAEILCPDNKLSCSDGQACCFLEGNYKCCPAKTEEDYFLTHSNDTAVPTNYNNSEASVFYSSSCITNSDCKIMEKCCPEGFCCMVMAKCCGNKCCTINSQCCSDGKTCCKNGMSCCDGGGCCPRGFPCCKDRCCPFLSRCCGGVCTTAMEKCCGGTMCTMLSTCCTSDEGSWCCDRGKKCGKGYQTCGASGKTLSIVLLLVTWIVVRAKNF